MNVKKAMIKLINIQCLSVKAKVKTHDSFKR